MLALAGEGPSGPGSRLARRSSACGLVLVGDVDWDRIVELYVAADVFALLSAREPWAVVVNEAAACGLPLVLSDRVGAAHDLLRDGENGALVPAGDVDAAATALRELAADPSAAPSRGPLARARARLGLRAERRGLPRRGARGRRRSRLACSACPGNGFSSSTSTTGRGVEATAHLLTELCEALAEDYEVEVVTGVLHGHEDEPRQIEHNGVRITRVASDVVRALRARAAGGELRLVPRIGAQARARAARLPTSCCA